MVNQLDIANVINISVTQSAQALSAFNTSNLALFTSDTPTGSFPSTPGFQLYLSPDQVALDFGTSSVTYKQAVNVFAQSPNLLAGNGYLVIIALTSMETIAAAIARTKPLVSYFGVLTMTILSEADLLAAAAVLQANNMLGFLVQKSAATIAVSGSLDLLRSGSLSRSRGLYYGSSADLDALLYAAAYASRALSTNFNGERTVGTMHLKPLANVQPDPTLTQAQLNLAMAAGADTYPSIQGIPVAFSSGANRFYDQIFNQSWLQGALSVAGFNYLAGASFKIPQTEDGMDGLKSAYAQVTKQAVRNGYASPGRWTSATTFGNQQDLLDNIAQVGWYMYSQPIATQSVSARNSRQAPLVQIAIKEAGAMHSSSVIVNINA